ncbi:hypothetical protein EJ02DRAFT_457349 [Clathrospora elynae]|uniref:Uncharacterized protein n=1 Tax=Clathrospora elynae TaxID=706981 RepID=A0A6A5SP70_9PLEO|nr:hypothetical protein EJ02DRAFT_457349 [Clathrospora elynae]
MKAVLACIALLAATTSANVVFDLSSEPNGQGIQKSWLVDRWTCHNLADDGFDKQASWAFVDSGLANGCELYEEADCAETGRSLFVAKNNSNILGPGPVNLKDYNFDKIASSFICL